MDRLYAGIAAGQPPVTALRDAKLALVRGGGVYTKPVLLGALSTIHGHRRQVRACGVRS